jgi:hypothetical protein
MGNPPKYWLINPPLAMEDKAKNVVVKSHQINLARQLG